jgi:hypothetical protein
MPTVKKNGKCPDKNKSQKSSFSFYKKAEIVVCLNLHISVQAAPDPNNHYMRAIQDQYNVQISFRQKQKNFHTTTCVVKVKSPPYTCVEREREFIFGS